MIKARLAGLILLLSFASAPGAWAQELEILELAGDWEISLSRNDAGEFEVCQATLSYQNGEAIIFYSNGFGVTMGLLLERWQLDANSEYDIAIQFGDNPRLAAKALAGADKKSALVGRNFKDNLAEIASADAMYLHTAAGSLRYALSDTREALTGLIECATAYNPSIAE